MATDLKVENSLKLEDLLAGLNSEAEKESSGVFTLDERSALKRLAQFQLADPFQYCLRWLQAAVAGRASYFNWRNDNFSCYAELGGYVIDPKRIAGLPTLLLDSQAGRAEQHLSAGLTAVLRTHTKEIRLRSGAFQATWRPGQFQFERKELGLDGTKIELLFNLGRTDAHKESDLLHAQACAPVSMSIGPQAPRRKIGRLADFYGAELREHLVHSARHEGFHPPPFRLDKNYPRCRLYLARLTSKQNNLQSLLYLVRDGVWLSPRPLADVTNTVVFADASHLQADLTGLQIVENQGLTELQAEIRTALFKVI
ncbi:MAG: hypothetical protein U0931_24305 [Vulcanimicrobiota bacterium]